jgi:hypothetical protein
MNRHSKTIVITLAITLFAMQGAEPAAKTSVTVKEAGRAAAQTPNTILSGSGVPAKSIGINGDFYIDIKSANLYGPKTKGVWKVATSLKAPVSKNKVTPVSGPAGAVGANGAKGATGDRGLTGATGNTGAKGETGLTGAVGLIGPAGANGTQGISGAVGAKGESGLNGGQGATGATGANGVAGAAGASGLAGSNGTPGSNGAAGVKGDTGLTGAAGISNSYFVDIQQWTLSTSVNSGTSDSVQFGTLVGNGSYTFEIVLDGTFSPGTATQMSIGMQLIASTTPVSLQYRVFTSDSTSSINSVGGRHYQFLILGTIVCSASTTSLTLRAIDQYGATVSNMLSFSGKILINKVGTIG